MWRSDAPGAPQSTELVPLNAPLTSVNTAAVERSARPLASASARPPPSEVAGYDASSMKARSTQLEPVTVAVYAREEPTSTDAAAAGATAIEPTESACFTVTCQ